MCGFLKKIINKTAGVRIRKQFQHGDGKTKEVTWEEMLGNMEYEVRNGYDRDDGIVVYIKVTNKTDILWGKPQIKLNMTGRSILRLKESTSALEILESEESRIFKFYFTPLYRPGIVKLYPIFSFFDFDRKKTIVVPLQGKQIDMKMPLLSDRTFKMVEIFDVDWKVIVSSMEDKEIHTEDIPDKPSVVFLDLMKTIQTMGLHSFKPELSPQVYRGIGRFWAEGVGKEKYGIHLEVIGKEHAPKDETKSRALLIFYSSDHMNITPFTSGVMHHIKEHSAFAKYFQID